MKNFEIWADNEGIPVNKPDIIVHSIQEAREWIKKQDHNWTAYSVHYNGKRINAEAFVNSNECIE